MRIVVPDRINISKEHLNELSKLNAIIFDDVPKDSADLIKRIKDAEIITANYIDIDQVVIDAAPTLKYIIVPAVGYEWVNVEHASRKGIRVINCPTHNSWAVAEHAIALLFAATRHLTYANNQLTHAIWSPTEFIGTEVRGKRMGLIGHGNIGRRIESLANSLGMITTFVDSRSSSGEVDSVIRRSDILIVCAPLSKATRHLIDARRLALMHPDTYLINVSRGELVDQQALIQVLKYKSIRGAGLDVFEHEPLLGKPNQEIVELAKMPNVVATPHMAYNTGESAKRLGEELITNIKAVLANAPINVVNSESLH